MIEESLRPRNFNIQILLLIVAVAMLFVVDMCVGSSEVGIREITSFLCGNLHDETLWKIIIDIRLYKATTAVLCGAALSVSGLQMQTFFRNPLAGPYVLGVSSGASLGVALFIMGMPLLGGGTLLSAVGSAGAAWIGAATVLGVVFLAARRISDIMVLLILGMMFSSGAGALVEIIQYLSPESNLKQYVVWTMGSLGEVSGRELALLGPAVAVGLLLSVAMLKHLNMLALGSETAVVMGVNMRKLKNSLFISTTLLTGTVTAFCGPIGFIGLAMPHVARFITSSYDQRILFPTSALVGAIAVLICDICSKQFMVPINAVASLMGIPIVVLVVLRSRK